MRYGIVLLEIAELVVRVSGSAAAIAGLCLMLCVARSTIQSPFAMSRVPVSIVRLVDLFLINSPLASNTA